MDLLALVISVVALGLAMKTFQRTDTIQHLQQQIEELNAKIEYTTKGTKEVNEDIQDVVKKFIGSLKNRQSQ